MTFSPIILKIATCILKVFVSRLFYPFILKRQISVNVVRRFRFREHFPKPPHLVSSVRLKTLTRKERRRVENLFSHFPVSPRAWYFFARGYLKSNIGSYLVLTFAMAGSPSWLPIFSSRRSPNISSYFIDNMYKIKNSYMSKITCSNYRCCCCYIKLIYRFSQG